MRTRGRALIAAAWCLPLLIGCGGSVELRSNFPDNRPEHIEALLARLPAPSLADAPTNLSGRPLVVVALHGDDGGVAAFDASDGRELWRRPVKADAPPTIGGPVVIVRSGQKVLGLSVTDGSQMWSRDTGTIDYMGAAVDDGVAVLTFSTAGQRASSFREGRAQAIDARSGRVLWSLGPVEKQLGAPAAYGGVAFIPWDRLSLSAFDLHTGEEMARLLSRDDVYAFVKAGPEGVFYGSTGLYRLTKASASGSREESSVHEPLVANAPAVEGFGPDTFLGTKGGRNARNKIRFLWRGGPSTGDEVSLVDDTTYFLYYRIVFAFDSTTGAVRWVRMLDGDAEAATVVPGGVVLLTGDGRLTALAAENGATVHHVELGVEIDTADFDLGALPRGGGADEGPSGTVRQQLLAVIFDPDARLTPARRFAVALLAGMPDAQVTRDLLDVCSRRRIPESIRNDVALVLRTRQAGVSFLIGALDTHYDFLENRQAPPVGVIASAVLHQHDASAVERLWQHMLDPETPREDLAPIAQVMTELGDASLVPHLRDFVVRYHADSEFHGGEGTLLELVRAIARHGTDEDRAAMVALADDPLTLPVLARDLAEAAAPPPEPDEEDQEGAPAEEPASEVSEQQLGQVMESSRARIRPCVQSALRRNPELSEIRMNLVLNERGELEELTVEPHDDILGSCLTLSLGGASFPRGHASRREATYAIRIEH